MATERTYPGGPGLDDPETEAAVRAVEALDSGSHRLCPCGHASWLASNVCAACGRALHYATTTIRPGHAARINEIRYARSR